LMGPYHPDETAGRLACYEAPNGGAPSLDSYRQDGPALPVSGDPRCGASGPAPGSVELFHLRDQHANALQSETQSSLFNQCLADLERDPTKATNWVDFFSARPCISNERFQTALSTLLEAPGP